MIAPEHFLETPPKQIVGMDKLLFHAVVTVLEPGKIITKGSAQNAVLYHQGIPVRIPIKLFQLFVDVALGGRLFA
jgi:hypothetical protein